MERPTKSESVCNNLELFYEIVRESIKPSKMERKERRKARRPVIRSSFECLPGRPDKNDCKKPHSSIFVKENELFLRKSADDVTVISPNEAHLKISLSRLAEFAEENEFVINTSKSLTMRTGGIAMGTEESNLEMNGIPLIQVNQFRHPNFTINKK